MQGEVCAGRSELGGLRVDVRLQPALLPEAAEDPQIAAETEQARLPGGAPA
jgi:hypothetical protein